MARIIKRQCWEFFNELKKSFRFLLYNSLEKYAILSSHGKLTSIPYDKRINILKRSSWKLEEQNNLFDWHNRRTVQYFWKCSISSDLSQKKTEIAYHINQGRKADKSKTNNVVHWLWLLNIECFFLYISSFIYFKI